MKKLRPRAQAARAYLGALADCEAAAADDELASLRAEAEQALAVSAAALSARTAATLEEPVDSRLARLLVEVRSGVGGEEAALWSKQVVRMLKRYSLRQGWKVDDVYLSESKSGGVKE